MTVLWCVLLLQICTQDYTPVSYDGGESILHLAGSLHTGYLLERPLGAEVMLTAAQPWFLGMLQSKTCSTICPTT